MASVVSQRKNLEGFPKAGELIEIRPLQELTLQDRRIINLLIENAGPSIAKDTWHEVPLVKLRGIKHKGSERVSESLERLMRTIVQVPTKDRNDLPAVLTTVLISENLRTLDENDHRAMLRYKFTETLRGIIEKSSYWGRIKSYVMFAFSTKYALALYEAVSLRANLKISMQEIPVNEFRLLLGVAENKLTRFVDLNRFAILPAVEEVNALSDFTVEVEPMREGGPIRGKLIGFRLHWRRKEQEEWMAVLDELMRPKVGRKARIRGEVERAA